MISKLFKDMRGTYGLHFKNVHLRFARLKKKVLFIHTLFSVQEKTGVDNIVDKLFLPFIH